MTLLHHDYIDFRFIMTFKLRISLKTKQLELSLILISPDMSFTRILNEISNSGPTC